LFGAAFAARWIFSSGDWFGDEAWYFYLARTLGLERAAAADNAWFHLSNRPLFYAIFHAGTWGGALGFRLLGTFVGALVPPLCFAAARALGASRGSAALLASLLCLQRQHLEHAAHGFPDLLATVFALGAIWAAASGRARATFTLALCCVLCKESFIAIPAVAAWLRLSARAESDVRLDRWTVATVAVPTLFVATVTMAGWAVPGLAMQGWSSTAFSLKHARNMWVGPELWPFIVWFGYRREWRLTVLWLALPAFYLAWSFVLGRGLAPWYAVGPSSLSAVAAALALDRLRLAHWRASTRVLVVVAFVLCLLPVPVLGAARMRAEWNDVAGRKLGPSIAPEVMPILAEQRPTSLLLVNCFWAYGYSHLRAANGPAVRMTWATPEDVEAAARAARNNELTIVCRDAEHRALELLLLERGLPSLLVHPRWLVLRRPD
jgi:hypothetical protein